MYRVIKEKGNNQNITLENTETKASVIIGKLTMDIMRVLETEMKFDETTESGTKLRDKWDFTISDDAGKALSATAMAIHKPARDQSKKAKQESEQIVHKKKTKSGKEVVDVFDLIFGTN